MARTARQTAMLSIPAPSAGETCGRNVVALSELDAGSLRRGSGNTVTDSAAPIAVLVAHGLPRRLGARRLAFGAKDRLAFGT
jgi:hypothetical protein